MPLNPSLIASLISAQPAMQYRPGTFGAGLMNGIQMRQGHEMDMARHGLAQQQMGLQQDQFMAAQAARQQAIKQEAIDEYTAAVHRGDTSLIDVTAQKLGALGLQVEVSETPMEPSGVDASQAVPPAPGAQQSLPTEFKLDNSLSSLGSPITPGIRAPSITAPSLSMGSIQPPVAQEDGSPPNQEAAPVAPPAPRGKKYRILEGGKLVSELDPTAIRASQEKSIDELFDGLKAIGDKDAAEAGRVAAKKRLGYTSVADAINEGQKLYQSMVVEKGKTARVPGGGGGAPASFGNTGLSKDSYGVAEDAYNAWKAIHDKEVTDNKLPAVNEAIKEADQLQSLTRLGSGQADVAAVTQLLKSLQGRISDADMRQMMGSGGVWQQLGSLLGKAQNGQIDARFMAEINRIGATTSLQLKKYRQGVAERARNRVSVSPHPVWATDARRRQEDSDRMYHSIMGTPYQPRASAPAPAAPSAPGAAPASSADAEAAELLGGL